MKSLFDSQLSAGWSTILHSKQVRQQNWADYQQAARNRLDVLAGLWMDQLIRYGQRILGEKGFTALYRKCYPWSTHENAMADVIDEIAVVYSSPVRRRFVVGEGEDSKPDNVYDKIIEKMSYLNTTMDTVQRYMLACGGVIVRPALLPNNPDRWVFHVLTPDLFVPIADPDDPCQLIELQYVVPMPDSINISAPIYRTHKFSIRDKTKPVYEMLDAENRVEFRMGEGGSQPYPYYNEKGDPILPFAIFRFQNEPFELFNRSTGLDIYDATMICALLEVIKNWQLIQSRKQPVVTGPQAAQIPEQIADMSIPWTMPVDADEASFTVVDLIDDGSRYDVAIDKIKERILHRRGLSSSDFKDTAQVESGKALKIKSKKRGQYLALVTSAMSEGEQAMASVMRTVWNAHHTTDKISEEGRFEIQYTDYLAVDPYENFDQDVIRIEQGTLSKPKWLRMFDPDIKSDEIAESMIKQNQKVNNELTSISPDLARVEKFGQRFKGDGNVKENAGNIDGGNAGGNGGPNGNAGGANGSAGGANGSAGY